MSKICEICGKRPVYGNNVSHAHNKTRRRWEPNLKKTKIIVDGTVRSVNVCMKCLKKGSLQKAI
jgi:large subunit ribosomal protein L28